MPKKGFITFPPDEIGPEPVRIPVLAEGDGWIAFDKPAGVAATPHFLNGDFPNLLEAIQAGVSAGKRQFLELGLERLSKVHLLESAITGAALFGTSEQAGAGLREALGSRQIEFVYDLVAESALSLEARECDLPVAYSRARMEVHVSHRHGKKSLTRFRPVARYGHFSLWEASTFDARPLQVRLHAAESGLCIPGERRFGRVPHILLSGIKRKYRRGSRPERPLHQPLCLHLRAIILHSGPDGKVAIECPRPRSLQVTLALLEEHLGCEQIAT